MRHRVHRHTLGLKKEHRKAMLRSLAEAALKHGRITTTLTRAKALRPFLEKLITKGKKFQFSANLDQRAAYCRQIRADIGDDLSYALLLKLWAREFRDRAGGYARIYKLGFRRGDAADMALFELILPADGTNYREVFSLRKRDALLDRVEARDVLLELRRGFSPPVAFSVQQEKNDGWSFSLKLEPLPPEESESWPRRRGKAVPIWMRITFELPASALIPTAHRIQWPEKSRPIAGAGDSWEREVRYLPDQKFEIRGKFSLTAPDRAEYFGVTVSAPTGMIFRRRQAITSSLDAGP